MKYHEFTIELKESLRSKEVIHREVIPVALENCVKQRGSYASVLIIKPSYLASSLLPYFDFLHDYQVIRIYVTEGTNKNFDIQFLRERIDGRGRIYRQKYLNFEGIQLYPALVERDFE